MDMVQPYHPHQVVTTEHADCQSQRANARPPQAATGLPLPAVGGDESCLLEDGLFTRAMLRAELNRFAETTMQTTMGRLLSKLHEGTSTSRNNFFPANGQADPPMPPPRKAVASWPAPTCLSDPDDLEVFGVRMKVGARAVKEELIGDTLVVSDGRVIRVGDELKGSTASSPRRRRSKEADSSPRRRRTEDADAGRPKNRVVIQPPHESLQATLRVDDEVVTASVPMSLQSLDDKACHATSPSRTAEAQETFTPRTASQPSETGSEPVSSTFGGGFFGTKFKGSVDDGSGEETARADVAGLMRAKGEAMRKSMRASVCNSKTRKSVRLSASSGWDDDDEDEWLQASREAARQREATKAMKKEAEGTGSLSTLRKAATARFDNESEDSTTQEYKLWETMASMIINSKFDYCSAFFIVCNAILTGIQTENAARNPGRPAPTEFRILDTLFCVIFTIELLLKIFVYRKGFYKLPEWKWNIFDTILVAMQIAEELLALIASASGMSMQSEGESGEESTNVNFSFMRVMRILRLVRIVRLFRVLRIIGELRTIVASIAGCMRPLVSAIILLLLMIYVVGVFFTQAVSTHIAGGFEAETPLQDLHAHFGTLPDSIFSLYKAILGGIDWGDLADPIVEEMSTVYGLIFAFYIAFSVLAMMNVMTGVFVEAALEIAKNDEDQYLTNHMNNLLKATDVDDTGLISWDAFAGQLHHPAMQEYFKSLNIDATDGRALFNILDVDEVGMLPAEDFVSGCLRLRGPSRALDLEVLSKHHRKAFQNQVRTLRQIEATLGNLLREMKKR
eukprot:TRINITY_DN6993_c0_g1_i2.p1 TRINITY_DN6993_c0_g1~~TRINITY_DN6993_c0_g1_i2.p1  ORF type:complete len:794 (+),score=185.35 TRINITY_DN6993_c0_g1_i2:130-2511(+)